MDSFALKEGCQWLIDGNGKKCKKKCVSRTYYCKDHKEIPDIPRNKKLTESTCRKRIISNNFE